MLDPLLVGQVLFVLLLPGVEARQCHYYIFCNRVQNVGTSAGGTSVENSFSCLEQVSGFSAVSSAGGTSVENSFSCLEQVSGFSAVSSIGLVGQSKQCCSPF